MMKKQKKGISLIILVITIIIMIILATTIIISLSNNGIIDKAHEAVEKTNEKQVQELANTAWAKAYSKGARTKEKLKSVVEEALEENNINKEDYVITVTTTGVTVSRKNGENNTEEDNKEEEKEVWVQKADRTVVKGDTVLNIGEYVNYISGVEGYNDTNGWRVLGAENGELLIMSATDVTTKFFKTRDAEGFRLKEETLLLYKNGADELDELCKSYGKGENALGARSITVEDVDRVTGFNKKGNQEGETYEYGNIVTYSYNGTNKPSYSGTNGVSGTLGCAHDSGFYWYDMNNVYHSVSASDLTNETNIGKELAKVMNTYYAYTASSATDLKEKAPNAYNMLFGSSDGNYYWLASSFVLIREELVYYGIRSVERGLVMGKSHLQSSSLYVLSNDESGVRAVVHLSRDFNP